MDQDENYYRDGIKRISSIMTVGMQPLSSAAVENTAQGFMAMDDYSKAEKYRAIYNGEVVAEDFKMFIPGRFAKNQLNKITHKDIVSPKVKVLLSLESARPYDDILVAVNPEATTQREEKETQLLKQYTRDQIMMPIQQMVMQQTAERVKDRQLTPQEMEELQAQMQEQIKSMEPKSISKYMLREFQTPADVAGNQMLNFLKKHRKLKYKFGQGLKEAALTRHEVYRVIENYGHPDVELIEGQRIKYIESSYSKFIHDADVVICQHDWSYERILQEFPKMTAAQRKSLRDYKEKNAEAVFFWNSKYHAVTHYLWRDQEEAMILTYETEDGSIETEMVDADYKVENENETVEKRWVDVIHEAWAIGDTFSGDLLKYGKLEGQYRDLERPKMPYYGARYEDWFMQRMAVYQMLYSIVWFRLETLLGKMKSNKTALNAKSMAMAGGGAFDIDKWMSYMNEDDLIILDPTAEGGRNDQRSIGDLVKELNMTNTSDIAAIEKLLEYLDYKAGETVGVPKQLEGQIAEREGVANVNKVFNTTLRLLEPYYEIHDMIKDEVTCALVDKARSMYKKYIPQNLYYVLDDMSINWIKMDTNIFSMSQYGLFNTASTKVVDTLAKIENVTSLYAQNSGAKFSTLIKVGMTNNPTEALEYVIKSENEQEMMAQQKQKADFDNQMALEKEHQKTLAMMHEQNKEIVILKETERRKTEIEKSAIIALGFDPEKDKDDDGTPDVVEFAKLFLQEKKDAREQKKLEMQERESEAKIQAMKEKPAKK